MNVPLRPPQQVMRLERMGTRYQTRLSFMRTVLRRLRKEQWTVEQSLADWDDDGYGTAVYCAKGPNHTYSLVAYSTGLPAFIAVKVLAPGYYARQDTSTPVKIAIVAMVTNMLLNLIFVGLLLFRGFEGPHAGLALASSAAAYLNAILLFRGLRKRDVYIPERGWIKLWIAVILACTTMGALLIFMTHDTNSWLQAVAGTRVRNLALTISFGVIIYIFTCMVAGLNKQDLVRGAN